MDSTKRTEIIQRATETFGDEARANSYLSKPLARFGGCSCLEMLDEPDGKRRVEELLTRIDHGIYG